MPIFADFHIHSKYSRATSKDMDLAHLNAWAKIKGIDVLGTGDFTHSQWLKEAKAQLEPMANGLFRFKRPLRRLPNSWEFALAHNMEHQVNFILSSEISCIYSKNGAVRKVHVLILAPSFAAVEKINTQLAWIGNLKSDGRPILGLDVKELTKMVLKLCPDCLIIPAHIWTPWFSLFGSKSGFDKIEDCFEELTEHIFAFETGLSSDPPMNWRLSGLDKLAMISNSDCHSPSRIGREANIFDGNKDKLSYRALSYALRLKKQTILQEQKLPLQLQATIEFFPEQGRYHYDGHRKCNIAWSPEQTKKHQGICPKCKRPVTVGVMSRVEALASRKMGFKPKQALPFQNLIPLDQVLGDALGVGPATKKVNAVYQELIANFGNEFAVLRDISREDLEKAAPMEVVEAIMRNRQAKVHIEPGYDGEYGQVQIFTDKERASFAKQNSLF